MIVKLTRCLDGRASDNNYSRGRGTTGTSHAGVEEPILRPEEIRLLPERHALVIAENAKPLIAKLTRCLDGRSGRELLAAQAHAAARVGAARGRHIPVFARTTAAVETAHQLDLTPANPNQAATREHPDIADPAASDGPGRPGVPGGDRLW